MTNFPHLHHSHSYCTHQCQYIFLICITRIRSYNSVIILIGKNTTGMKNGDYSCICTFTRQILYYYHIHPGIIIARTIIDHTLRSINADYCPRLRSVQLIIKNDQCCNYYHKPVHFRMLMLVST